MGRCGETQGHSTRGKWWWSYLKDLLCWSVLMLWLTKIHWELMVNEGWSSLMTDAGWDWLIMICFHKHWYRYLGLVDYFKVQKCRRFLWIIMVCIVRQLIMSDKGWSSEMTIHNKRCFFQLCRDLRGWKRRWNIRRTRAYVETTLRTAWESRSN